MKPRPTCEELELKIRQLEEEAASRRNTDEALLHNEEKYRAILAGMEDGYFEVDLKGNLTFFNPALCKTLGYTARELMGMNNRCFMSEATAKEVFRIFSEVYRTGKSSPLWEWEIVAKDGSRRSIETSVSLVRDSLGQAVGFRGIGRDITERRLAEQRARLQQQQLFQASKMVALGTLVSGVAHEINNPNNFIMLNTPVLMEAWESAMPILDAYREAHGEFVLGGLNYSDMRGYIPTLFSGILDGSKRIQQIVEDLKHFLRKDTSDINQPVDVNAVVRSSISLLSNMIQKSTHRFSVHYAEELPRVRGSFQKLEQVVINLIQNACQALTEHNQSIEVSTRHDSATGQNVVAVRDEGVGISPENLPQILDPFFTTRHDSGGTGLGLSISSRIVEEHGGTMHFESEPGLGTRVEVALPTAPPRCPPMEARR